MSYEAGAIKYLLKAFLYPIPYYIFGGTLMAVIDLLTIIFHDDPVEGLAWYLVETYVIPTSLLDALVQLALGAVMATLLWYAAVTRQSF